MSSRDQDTAEVVEHSTCGRVVGRIELIEEQNAHVPMPER
jgi:hypothetical protein